MEDILTEIDNRFVLFPIRYNAIWQMYKKAQSVFWTAEEIDLSKDMNDWEKLNDNERHFIKHVLAFFAGSDGIVNENLALRFFNDVKPQEAKAFYGFQVAMENIHCVVGSTEILTRDGYCPIEHLEDKEVDVWNGHEFSQVVVRKTSPSAKIYKVSLSNGMILHCTSQHKWLITGHEERVYTENLEQGMTLMPYVYPSDFVITDPMFFNNAYMHGFLASKKESEIEYNPTMFNCRSQLFVPVNYSKPTQIEWANGLLKQATTDLEDVRATTRFYHESEMFIKYVQLMFTLMNISSKMEVKHDQSVELSFDAANTVKLINEGVHLPQSQTIMAKYDGVVLESTPITIAKVEDLGVQMPTYCFNEPLRHTGVFNGILTGQSETYSLLIDTYIKDAQEKHRLLNAINTIPCITKKAQWAMKWIENKDAPFTTRLVGFACVEGIFFSGAFCAIFWLKERGVLPGLCTSNEFISRDEALHTEFAVLLYSTIKNKLSQEVVHEIVGDAVKIEVEFITESIPCNLLGMNAELMSQYIKFVADRLIVQLGYEKLYNVTNPFDFMERICLEDKVNFFEHRNAVYSKANVGVEQTDKHVFCLDADF